MFEQNPTLGPGTGTFAQHTFEILLMLLVAALIGLWLGWVLWSRYKQEVGKLSLDNQSLSATAESLRSELAMLKTRLSTADSDNNNLAAQVVSLNRNNANQRERIIFLETELAESQARNRQVETELGLSYTPETAIADSIPVEIIETATHETPADPAPEASVAAPAPELVIAPIASIEPQPEKPAKKPSKASSAPAEAIAAIPVEREDLTVVEGIGPKIQMLLNQYGIYTYQQLAETEVARLKEILAAAGPQLAMHDPGTWPSQANLAANDQWDTLASVQGFLKGGKKPD